MHSLKGAKERETGRGRDRKLTRVVHEVECEEIVPIAIHTLSLGEAALLW